MSRSRSRALGGDSEHGLVARAPANRTALRVAVGQCHSCDDGVPRVSALRV